MINKKVIVFLLGPTGVGKTDISILLAKRINARIISADSMQVYRGMDIGTAKPAGITILSAEPESRRIQPVMIKGVKHYLIDIIEPEEEFNVARFVELAQHSIEQVSKEDALPLVVGGSALYIYTLIKGIFKLPPLTSQKEISIDDRDAYQRLLSVDPESARTIHPRNLRRVRRAVEVYHLTGVPFSQIKREREGIEKRYRILKIGLIASREEIYRRVEKRVEEMFNQGLIEEVKRLKNRMSRTARQALGYKEVLSYLNGEISLKEAKELVKKNTRHFVKHQLTWFKKDSEIRWINTEGKEKEEVSQEVERIILKEVSEAAYPSFIPS
ncbi:MAG: tRNA (adenosine(37)-N6)-dimethylallyltransferase MiaA [Candidatus Omnitrophota bacterium]|nr:MAG: tRNA (adenosine(37)-N6)-dimethylallyltransferase MiaA [Candidatus Omnitrophota bacterium]